MNYETPKFEMPWHDPKINDPIEYWFGLSYCAYQVIPRSLLKSLPSNRQRDFIEIMEEIEAMGAETPDYRVQAVDDKGRFTKDPFKDYRNFDFAIIREKYNANREDHKLASRMKPGGKAY
jgi:hypothetical protein